MGRATLGEEAEWGVAEHLLAVLFDSSQVANWQRAARKSSPPKPVPRPGMTRGDRVGNAAGRSQDEIRAFLDALKPKAVTDGD